MLVVPAFLHMAVNVCVGLADCDACSAQISKGCIELPGSWTVEQKHAVDRQCSTASGRKLKTLLIRKQVTPNLAYIVNI